MLKRSRFPLADLSFTYVRLTAQLPRPGAMAVLGRLCTEPEVGLMVEHRDNETCNYHFWTVIMKHPVLLSFYHVMILFVILLPCRERPGPGGSHPPRPVCQNHCAESPEYRVFHYNCPERMAYGRWGISRAATLGCLFGKRSLLA